VSISVLASVHQHANQAGRMALYGVSRTTRYQRASELALDDRALWRQISSARLFSSSDADTTLILFAFPVPFLNFPNYTGTFVQYTNARSGSDLNVNVPSALNDLTDSLLLVKTNRGTEIRLSFRDLFLSRWRTTIDSKLSGGAKRDGDPVLTWEMFPEGISFLDPARIYLKVHQPLDIEIDWWPDYEASITYHLLLSLSGSGRLRGQVARWAYWIEGGAKADDIEDRLRPAVIAGMDDLDSQLSTILGGIPTTFTDLYYLPGRQLLPAGTGTLEGSTAEDVTIVLVR
jgi:hypothetical protein